ncbi:MAG: serine hydrolase [bacterium]
MFTQIKKSPMFIVFPLLIFGGASGAFALDYNQKLDDALAQQFQAILDGANVTKSGLAMGIYIPGRGLWIGVTGNAIRGEIISDASGRPIKDANGQAVKTPAVPLKPDDLFDLGCIAPLYTDVLMLKLIEKGKATLDDTLERRVPGLGVPYADEITIRQMMNHTSGVFSTVGFSGAGNILLSFFISNSFTGNIYQQ